MVVEVFKVNRYPDMGMLAKTAVRHHLRESSTWVLITKLSILELKPKEGRAKGMKTRGY